MDPKNPQDHPWQPRIDEDRQLNPSIRRTEPEGSVDERTLEQVEEQTEESEAREGDPEPIKISHRE
jgi:hypothetical protein